MLPRLSRVVKDDESLLGLALEEIGNRPLREGWGGRKGGRDRETVNDADKKIGQRPVWK